MGSTLSTEQETIKHCYEVLKVTPDIIAEDRGLDVVAVKQCLMSVSAKYRKDCGLEEEEKDDLNFSDEDLRDVNQIILATAKYSDDPHLRFKAATYVRDDKKGRKEVVKNQNNMTFNLLEFNASLAKIKEMKQAMIGQGSAVNV